MDRADAADLMDAVRTELGLREQGAAFPAQGNLPADLLVPREHAAEPARKPWRSSIRGARSGRRISRKLYRAYVERKQRCNILDYDDLLLYWHAMMADARLAQHVSAHFDHMLVDEYQDTNRLQAEILHALRPDGAGLAVVGDDAQAIYSFRAAAVDNILGFPDRFKPRAEVVTLAQNYRSTQHVLDVVERADGGSADAVPQASALDSRAGRATAASSP